MTCAFKDISRDVFRFLHKIGSGGFGQVWKVEFKKNSRPYAMKEISKVKYVENNKINLLEKIEQSILYLCRVILKKSVQSIMNEK
jgi:serine/threonine protein kinase